jgi:hypothetical protein
MKLILSLLVAGSLLSAGAFAEEITGYISDSHCGKKHSSPSEANTQCIQACLKGSSQPVLVSNGKVMKFDAGSREQAVAHAGENVKIDGTVHGSTITINSIQKAD